MFFTKIVNYLKIFEDKKLFWENSKNVIKNNKIIEFLWYIFLFITFIAISNLISNNWIVGIFYSWDFYLITIIFLLSFSFSLSFIFDILYKEISFILILSIFILAVLLWKHAWISYVYILYFIIINIFAYIFIYLPNFFYSKFKWINWVWLWDWIFLWLLWFLFSIFMNIIPNEKISYTVQNILANWKISDMLIFYLIRIISWILFIFIISWVLLIFYTIIYIIIMYIRWKKKDIFKQQIPFIPFLLIWFILYLYYFKYLM